MRLVVKHVRQKSNGVFEYRRRVPKDIATFIQKREFKEVLGSSEAEALRRYATTHDAVERSIATARQLKAGHEAAERGELGGLALRQVVEQRVANLLAGSDNAEEIRDIIADDLLSSYPRGPGDRHTEGAPLGVPEVERLTINLLRNPNEPAPPPTLQDAQALYIKDKLTSDNDGEHRKARQDLDRAFRLVKEALGSFPELAKLRRADAHKVRDHMLAKRKKNGQLIAPSSVQRALTVVNAVVNHGLRELDLKGVVANPFAELPVKGVTDGRKLPTSEADKRLPLPKEVRAVVRERLRKGRNRELYLVWRLLEGTGCRVAEVVGLRVQDVVVQGELPNIRVTWHDGRRLKGSSSIRHVPLVADALEAAKEALDRLSEASPMLFARYGREGGPVAASAALMKHVRKVTANPRHVVHSLRHNLKDVLIEAEIPTLEQNLILGHVLGGVGDRVYGGAPAKLRATKRALEKALQVEKRVKG